MAIDKSKQSQGLRDGHDGSQGERIAMSVLILRHSTDGVAEDFSRRLRNVFVIVGRTRLSENLQVPWELLASLDVQFRMTTAS